MSNLSLWSVKPNESSLGKIGHVEKGNKFCNNYNVFIINYKVYMSVVLISKLILDLLPDCKIYLFGSYAKRCIKESSDVDILILDKSINKDNKKDIRIKLRSYIDEKTNYKYELDLKLYNIDEFMQFKDIPLSFEQSINEYIIGVIN